MRHLARGILGLAVLAGWFSALKADSIFNFNDLALGTATTFTETDSGTTATFISLNQAGVVAPGAFDIEVNPTGLGTGPNRLIETDDASNDPAHTYSLRVNFSSSFTSASFPFAIRAHPGGELTLTAFMNGTEVGSATAVANMPYNFYSLGSLTFDAPAGDTFDSLLLSSNLRGFAIDNLDVSGAGPVSGVPEPAPTALVVLGIAGILACVRRHQQKKATGFASPQSSRTLKTNSATSQAPVRAQRSP